MMTMMTVMTDEYFWYWLPWPAQVQRSTKLLTWAFCIRFRSTHLWRSVNSSQASQVSTTRVC